MMNSKIPIEVQIYNKRLVLQSLIDIHKDLTDVKIIECSEELDKLILKYHGYHKILRMQ